MELTGNLSQGLTISVALTQAFEILKMNAEELFDHLEEKLESNPLITVYGQSRGIDGSIARYEVSLYEHLMMQARLVFRDVKLAEAVIGNLDERGFYTEPIADPETLRIIQTFDPPGIGARDVQESLLIQLRMGGHAKSLAYEVIERCYLDLLNGKRRKISHKLKCSLAELEKEIEKRIKPLDPFPGYRFDRGASVLPSIDLVIKEEVTINSPCPVFSLREEYEVFKNTPFYRHYLAEAKWLFRSIRRRHQLLEAIGCFLKREQALFLIGEGPLKPMMMKEAALLIGISEASLTRAVKGKLVACPLGVLPLRSFFSHNHRAKELLMKWIATENKGSPLSDEQLAATLQREGISIARRTVAKYRFELNIPSASRRKRGAPGVKNGKGSSSLP
ncbi:MAG: hypothetical protein KBC64_01755 [Simkaniaceae bacterium]|nr:hypothetical protein [Simkaniaceae bacterium]